MNIQTIASNLRKTIAGKEKSLAQLESRKDIPRAVGDQMAMTATIGFLKINIAELQRILQDVEQCVPKEPSNPYHNADSGLYGPEYQGQ